MIPEESCTRRDIRLEMSVPPSALLSASFSTGRTWSKCSPKLGNLPRLSKPPTLGYLSPGRGKKEGLRGGKKGKKKRRRRREEKRKEGRERGREEEERREEERYE